MVRLDRYLVIAALLLLGVPMSVTGAPAGEAMVSAVTCGVTPCSSTPNLNATHPIEPSGLQKRQSPFSFAPQSAPGVPYLTIFENQDSFQAARAQDEANDNGMTILIVNTHSQTMHFELPLTFQGDGIFGAAVQLPDGDGKWVTLRPGQVARLGNIPRPHVPSEGRVKYNAAVRAQHCDWDGGNCVGHTDHSNKGEWSVPYDTEDVNINHSLVDGFNMPVILNWGRASGATCRDLNCKVTPESVRELCPGRNTHGTWEHPICASECQLFGGDHCCRGHLDNPATCPPSNTHLRPVCERSYMWAHDDTMYEQCYPGKYMVWYFGLGDMKLRNI